MDDRERERYLAWRRAHGKDRRGRIYHRLRVAGAIATCALLGVTLGVAVGGWLRVAKRDAALPLAPSPGAAPEISSQATLSAAAAPSASTASVASTAAGSAGRVSAASGPSGNAPVASPGRDTASVAASATESTPAAAPARREASTTVVVVEPPAAPAPTAIVEPPSPPRMIPGVAAPSATAAAPDAVATPEPVLSESQRTIDKLKRAAGYIPEVWLVRKMAGWMKSQPAGELGPALPDRALPQAR